MTERECKATQRSFVHILSCEPFTLKIFDNLRTRWLRASHGSDTSGAARSGERTVSDTINNALAAAGLSKRTSPPGQETAAFEKSIHDVDTPNERPESPQVASLRSAGANEAGEFFSRSFTNTAGKREYKLYIPVNYSGGKQEPFPLVVMLHGCTQSPDDFAAGTRMNALADQHGFLVVYPAQAAAANGSKCWNWFRPDDQQRGRGEPSLIAGITREIASSYRVDERRIFVAGLSAGAAMAVILGATYPELFAGVGAHSGLPYGAAHDVPSAFGAMKAGPSAILGHPTEIAAKRVKGVPTIIFHGDSDHTVDADNGATILEQALTSRDDLPHLRVSTLEGTAGGRTYSRTVYEDATHRPVMEQWIVHGAGHLWSGGSPKGSFTDARGPDASAEIIRFFNAQPREITK